MKRKVLVFVICVFLPLALTAQQTARQFLLNLTKGVVYPLHYETQTELSYSMPGSMGSSSLFLSIDYLCKVVDKDLDSYTLWIYIDELKIDNLNEEPFNEDGLKREFQLFWSKYSNNLIYAISDNYLIAKINRAGKLLSFTGQDNFYNDTLQILSRQVPCEAHQSLLEALFNFLFKEIENQFDSLYDFHPGKGVALGANWNKEFSNSQLIYKYNYNYQRSSEDYDFISVTGDYIMPTMTKEFGLKTKGWLHGYYVLDKQSGWIIGSNLEGSIDTKETILIQGIQAFLKIKVIEFRRN